MWAQVGSLPVAGVDACGLATAVAGEVVSVGWKMKGEEPRAAESGKEEGR